MRSNQEDALIAWKAFIAKDEIIEGMIRPAVARSWRRCRAAGLDPWSSTYPAPDPELNKKKIEQNKALLAIAEPVMQLLFTIMEVNISICDDEGFVFKLISPLSDYPRTLGTYIEEATCGNGAITIALHERIPFRLDGYEHYRAIVHASSNASAPIMYGDLLVGVLNGVSLFGPMPDDALPMITASAKLIEEMSRGAEFNYEMGNKIINNSDKIIVIIDDNNEIITVNNAARKLTEDSLHHREYLSAKDVFILRETEPEQLKEKFFRLKGAKGMGCRLLRRGSIDFHGRPAYTVFVFDYFDSEGNCITGTNNKRGARGYYVGSSDEWQKVDRIIRKVAGFSSNVLIQGDTGTGKEVVAHSIHKLSGRKGKFVAINCGNIPKELLNSELFGYEKGAFTGARTEGSIGKFEFAHEGTLLLDEISEMSLDMQVSLLRFLQERTITKINSNVAKKVDVRIIAASNKDIGTLVREGSFREDLYYRLNVIELSLPPLKERKSDIPLLVEYFIDELSAQLNMPHSSIHDDALALMCEYDWPGNVRELKNAVEKALIFSESDEITLETIKDIIHIEGRTKTRSSNLEEVEKDIITSKLIKFGGNISKVAKELGMARNTLYRKIQKYNIEFKTLIVRK